MGDRRQTLRAVLHHEEGEWVAHCLDLDIVSTGPTQDQAAGHLVEAVTAQLEYAWEHDNFAYLYHPAPLDAWQLLAKAIQGKQPTLLRELRDDRLPTLLELQVVAA